MKKYLALSVWVAMAASMAAAEHPPEGFHMEDGEADTAVIQEVTDAAFYPQDGEGLTSENDMETEVVETPAAVESEIELDWGVETEVEEISTQIQK